MNKNTINQILARSSHMHRLVCCVVSELFASLSLIYYSILLFLCTIVLLNAYSVLASAWLFFSFLFLSILSLLLRLCLWCFCTPLLSVSGSLDSVWDRKWAGLGLRDMHVSDLSKHGQMQHMSLVHDCHQQAHL